MFAGAAQSRHAPTTRYASEGQPTKKGPGAPANRRTQVPANIGIWKNQIILRDVENLEEPLAKHAKYNGKLNAHLIALSGQNLRRIYEQLGAVPVKEGRWKIEQLKNEQAYFKSVLSKAKLAKESPELPTYDYKVPPLGPYQHRGVAYLTNVERAALFADCGCLAGDTLIRHNRGGGCRTKTIEELFISQERPRKNKKDEIITHVRSLKDDVIGLHPIMGVMPSGVKQLWRLELEDGKTLKATADHEIMTDRGWVELGKLTTCDSVMVDNLTKHKKKAHKVRQPKNGDKRIAVGKYHPHARYQPSHGGTSGSYLLEIHRAIVEAHLNGLALKEFVKRTYSDDCQHFKFIDPKEFHIHHKDGNHYNNDVENLEALLKGDHLSHHTQGYTGYKHIGHAVLEYSRVKGITKLKREMTYDIVCEDPYRNFVANGMVVHNCGKTYMAACATELLISKGLLGRGKTLICGKLATLHQGWLKDIERFTNLKASVLWLPTNYKKKEKILKLLAEPADVYIINHEGVRVYEEALAEVGFEMVVIDESTVLKSMHSTYHKAKGGAFGKAVMNVATKAKRRVIMTGTPAPNSPADLFGQMHFIDPNGFLLEASWRDFRALYMEEKFFGDPTNPNTVSTFYPTPESYLQVAQIVNPLAYRVKIRDVLKELPPLTTVTRFVGMSGEQHEHYEAMEETFHTEIDNEHIAVTIKLSQIQKLRQITGGFVMDAHGEVHAVDAVTEKIEMLDQLINEEIDRDQKIVIFAEYKHEFEMMAERYKDHGIVTYYGDVSPKQKMANLESFLTNKETRIIALHPASCAHGITLTNASYMIMYSFSYSAEQDYQAVHRIERAGQKNPMFVYYLICSDTIDEIMFDVTRLKHEKQAMLIDRDQESDKDAALVWEKLKEQMRRHQAARKKKKRKPAEGGDAQ